MNATDTTPAIGESYWVKREAERQRLRAIYLTHQDAMRQRYEADRERLVLNARLRRASDRPASPYHSELVDENLNFDYGLGSEEKIPDPRPRIERERADTMESVRLRLLWAVAAGGDEGVCAECAVAVIRFAEGDGRHWSDRALKSLHIRLCLAAGLTEYRFKAARAALVRELFIPL